MSVQIMHQIVVRVAGEIAYMVYINTDGTSVQEKHVSLNITLMGELEK